MKKLVIYFNICFGFVVYSFCYIYADEKKNADSFYGVDVSHYQGNIDWKKVKDSGITFAYIKASQGNHIVDPKFSVNLLETKKVNVFRGAYHFFEPGQNAQSQAQLFIKIINSHGGCKGSLPPALDIEVIGTASKEQLKIGIAEWLQIVEFGTGCKPIIYTNSAFWNQYFTNDEFSDYELWLAEYGKKAILPKEWKKETLWQFTDKDIVDGIHSKVDEDKFIGTKTELINLICD